MLVSLSSMKLHLSRCLNARFNSNQSIYDWITSLRYAGFRAISLSTVFWGSDWCGIDGVLNLRLVVLKTTAIINIDQHDIGESDHRKCGDDPAFFHLIRIKLCCFVPAPG